MGHLGREKGRYTVEYKVKIRKNTVRLSKFPVVHVCCSALYFGPISCICGVLVKNSKEETAFLASKSRNLPFRYEEENTPEAEHALCDRISNVATKRRQ